VYLAGYDADGNYVQDVTGDWSVSQTESTFVYPAGFSSTSYQLVPNKSGSGYLIATYNSRKDSVFIAISGDPEKFRYEFYDLSGNLLLPDSIKTGMEFRVRITALDAKDNIAVLFDGSQYLEWLWVAATDTVNEVSGDTAYLPPTNWYPFSEGQGTVSPFYFADVGTMAIHVKNDKFGITDTIRVIAIDGTGPKMTRGWTGDTNGDGYLDQFTVFFNEPLLRDTTLNGTDGGFTISPTANGRNTITVVSVRIDSAGQYAVLTADNTGTSPANITTEGRKFMDTGDRPVITYNGNGAILDIYGNQGLVASIEAADSAGPVVQRADYDRGPTEGDTRDDILYIWLSEAVYDSSWLNRQVADVFYLIGTGAFGRGATMEPGIRSDIQIHMGSGGTEVFLGLDSVALVTGVMADQLGNTAAPNNKPMVIHMPPTEGVILSLLVFPNPIKPALTQETRMVEPTSLANTSFFAGGGGVIKYDLNRDCKVNLKIFSLLGVPVLKKTLESGRLGSREGINTFFWNGFNQKGRQVGPGGYIIILKVQADDGMTDEAREKIGVLGK
jgi:hypothetical protein